MSATQQECSLLIVEPAGLYSALRGLPLPPLRSEEIILSLESGYEITIREIYFDKPLVTTCVMRQGGNGRIAKYPSQIVNLGIYHPGHKILKIRLVVEDHWILVNSVNL